MAVAIHVGKVDKMDYEYRTTDHVWINCRAWKVLRSDPKWEVPEQTETLWLVVVDRKLLQMVTPELRLSMK